MTRPDDLIVAIQGIRNLVRFVLRSQRVTITATSPLTVTLRDGSTVRGIPVTGLTYTVGGTAVALIADRSQPLVFPVS